MPFLELCVFDRVRVLGICAPARGGVTIWVWSLPTLWRCGQILRSTKRHCESGWVRALGAYRPRMRVWQGDQARSGRAQCPKDSGLVRFFVFVAVPHIGAACFGDLFRLLFAPFFHVSVVARHQHIRDCAPFPFGGARVLRMFQQAV